MNGQFARYQPRRKRCRNPKCRAWFVPMNSLSRACSPACAIVVGNTDAVRRQRAKDRETKARLKTRSEVMKEAQAAFNWFIRERDFGKPCISSGVEGLDEPLTGGSWDCGHYRSIGANPELRFCELNAHKQTKHDNRSLSGNVVNYRIGLRARIGDANLEWLEGYHEPKKWTKAELETLRDFYRREARRLQKARDNEARATA